jgi:hypothetical protein
MDDNVIMVHAGALHGISTGARFDIYCSESGQTLLNNFPVGKVRPMAATIEALNGGFPSTIYSLAKKLRARTTYLGDSADNTTYVYGEETVFGTLDGSSFVWPPNAPRIILKNESENYNVAVKQAGENCVVFELPPSKYCTELYRLPYSIPLSKDALIPLFLATANFFYHLQRSRKKPSTSIKIEARKLLESYFICGDSDDDSDDEEGSEELLPIGDNLIDGDSMKIKVRDNTNTKYGFAITNKHDRPFYVWVFLFNLCDLSIRMCHV